MLRSFINVVKYSRIRVNSDIRRNMSFRRVKEAYKYIFKPQQTVPYKHVCQVGDPVLRTHAQPVPPETIESPEFQRMIKHLTDVMKQYNAMALSATQVGLSYQIFLIEVTETDIENASESCRKIHQMEVMPLKVFINPKMKIIDYATIKANEECLSILGYSAVVPRAKTVKIEALDASGKPFVLQADGWSARIIQHEMDHLQGKMYIDHMDPSTFSCTFWSRINAVDGYLKMQFYPKSWLRRYL